MNYRPTGKVAFLFTRLALVIVCSLARAFPAAIYWIADCLARIGVSIFFGYRKRSIDNIQIAFNTTLDQSTALAIAQRSLRNFFRASVEMATFLEASDAEYRARIPVDGWENLAAALAKQKGALILSAHLGNFFLTGSRLAVEGFPIHVLVNQPRDNRTAKLMDDYRLKVRQKTIHARPRRQALRELSLVLRANQVALIIADEYRQTAGIAVPFFGKTVRARRGPVTLALRTGAAVVPACLVRQPDDTLKMLIEPELELDRSGRDKAHIRENTIRMTQWLERTVRRYPDQWNWMNIRWWSSENDHAVNETPHVKEAS